MGVMGIERKPWSYADDAKLRELWETTPSSKLAAIFGRSRNAVIGRAQAHIHYWLKHSKAGVPPQAAIEIEEALNKEVTRHELRPDIFGAQA